MNGNIKTHTKFYFEMLNAKYYLEDQTSGGRIILRSWEGGV